MELASTASHILRAGRRRVGAIARWVPAWVVAPGLRRFTSYTLAAGADGVDDRRLAVVPRGAAVDVVVSADLFLVRIVNVPQAALAHAGAAADLQMRQTLPNQGRDVVWRAGPPNAVGPLAAVEVYVLKRARLAALLAALEARGLRPRTVRVAREERVAPFVDNRGSTDRAVKGWALLSLFVVLASIAISTIGIGRELAGLHDRLEELRAERSRLADRAAALRAEADASQQNQSQAAADRGRLDVASGRLAHLARLTALLPDGVWLSELRVDGERMSLSGFADDDFSAVVTALQNEAWTRNVRLEAPVTVDDLTGKSRFELAMVLSDRP